MRRPIDFLADSERSLWLISRVGVKIQNLNRAVEQACGMSLVQWCAMRSLVDSPGASAQELAEAVGVHPSTLTPTLRRLEIKKFIFVDSHPKDSRIKIIFITRQGKAALDRVVEMPSLRSFELGKLEADLTRLEGSLQAAISPKPE